MGHPRVLIPLNRTEPIEWGHRASKMKASPLRAGLLCFTGIPRSRRRPVMWDHPAGLQFSAHAVQAAGPIAGFEQDICPTVSLSAHSKDL